MSWIIASCSARTARAARQRRLNVFVLCGLLVLAASSALHASVNRPVFQGAAAPRSGGGSGGGFPHPNLGTPGFNIVLSFSGTPTPGELAAFQNAEATWESIITGYQITDIAHTDVLINAILGPMDGLGGVLGSAGPTFAKLNAAQNAVTSTFVYADEGDMQFDSADTVGLIGAGLFDEVILHEMGHVLGIGTIWSSSDVGFPGRQETYVFNSGKYTGAAGLAAYNDEFGLAATFVPVELGGGGGTANGHWNEVNGGAGLTGVVSNVQPPPFNDMAYELMTGWLNAPLFISNLTKQSMIDLGYTVVPEPSTLVLTVSVMLLAARGRRRA
jgi:hypothetical protein